MKYRIVRRKNPSNGQYYFYPQVQHLRMWFDMSNCQTFSSFQTSDAAEKFVKDSYEPKKIVAEGEAR